MLLPMTSGPSLFLILNAVVLAYVLLHRPRTRVSRAAATLALGVVLWGLGGTVSFLSDNRLPWLRLAAVGGLLIPANLAFFTATLAEGDRPGKSRVLLPLLYATALLLYLGLDLSPVLAGATGSLSRPGGYHLRDPRYLWIGAYVLAGWGYAFLQLATLLLREPGSPDPRAVRFSIVALLAPSILGAIFIPILGAYAAGAVPTVSFVGVLVSDSLLFAAFYFRLVELDVTFLLKKLALYGLACLLVGPTIIGIVMFIERFVELRVDNESVVVLAAIGAGVALLFAVVKDKLEEGVERMFFWKAYRYERLIQKFEVELREARERLRRAERLAAVGELAAVVAHEIKNPLGPIRGYAELLASELARNPAVGSDSLLTKGVGIILEEVAKIDKRVHDLLELGREELPRVEPCPLPRILERALMLVQFESGGLSRIGVVHEIDANLPPVDGDPDLLEQAFVNLLQNAMQAMPKGGRLRIAAHVGAATSPGAEPLVRISVIDSGGGIAPERLASLFNPFQTTKRRGHGLGLVIVKNIVEKHRGRIQVESPPGTGTTVVIELPVRRAPAEAPAPAPTPTPTPAPAPAARETHH